jgi:hypothetical protein
LHNGQDRLLDGNGGRGNWVLVVLDL